MSKWLLNELGRGGDRGAGARENRGRERAGSGRTGGGGRDLYEGGKREQK